MPSDTANAGKMAQFKANTPNERKVGARSAEIQSRFMLNRMTKPINRSIREGRNTAIHWSLDFGERHNAPQSGNNRTILRNARCSRKGVVRDSSAVENDFVNRGSD